MPTVEETWSVGQNAVTPDERSNAGVANTKRTCHPTAARKIDLAKIRRSMGREEIRR
jgi:hypothetical protein